MVFLALPHVVYQGAGAQMTEFRVIVTGLPPSASWQDLKDHMRKAGEPTYTDVVSACIVPRRVMVGWNDHEESAIYSECLG